MTTNGQIRPVAWGEYQDTLSRIRRQVFIEEQNVPEELEWDGEDPHASHWLAETAAGEPIGTARMLRSGQIGRLAVLPQWRRQGIGGRLLQAAVDHGRTLDLRDVFLHAQLAAKPLYKGAGFTERGPEYMEAGIPHVTMYLHLREAYKLGVDHGKRAASDIKQIAADMAAQSRRRVYLLSHRLDAAYYDNAAFARALSTLCRQNRDGEVRILIVDNRELKGRTHAVVALSQRLSSSVRIRKCRSDEIDIRENFLVADGIGVLCYTVEDHEVAWVDYNNRPVATDYAKQFDELWQRSREDPELRRLSL